MSTARVLTDEDKFCRKCETIKPLREFSNNAAARDGKQRYCKACWSAYNRPYQTGWAQRRIRLARQPDGSRPWILRDTV